jgi:transposase
MPTATSDTFSDWLARAQVPQRRLTTEQLALLQAAFRFRQDRGTDYYSSRLLSHFLLHCGSGLKVAQLARLVGISRPTASRQQGLSSKQAIQQAHHRMDGRPYGKLLPRYAGPIAHFLLTRQGATRADLIDFISDTFGVRVCRIALYKFLKKYGLDHVTGAAAAAAPPQPASVGTCSGLTEPAPVPCPAPPFCSGARSTRVPS